MAKFSINNDALSITLEQSENNFLIVNSLKNRYFLKEKNGIFTHKKKDAEKIIPIRGFLEQMNLTIEFDDEVKQILDEFERIEREFNDSKERAEEIKNRDSNEFENLEVPEFKEGSCLLKHQIKPVVHGLALKNSANFSVPGAGKTWMAFATYFLAKHQQELPTIDRLLVICPIPAMQVWEEEYEIITGKSSEDKCIRITKDNLDDGIIPRLAENKEIILINYDKLAGVNAERFLAALQLLVENFNFYIILDESHKIKNYEYPAKTGPNVALLAENHRGRRMVLTGTPMPNYLLGLWNQFHFLFPKQDILRPYPQFKNRVYSNNPLFYTTDAYAQLVAETNDELNAFFVRVTDAQLDLTPAAEPALIECDMEREQDDIVMTISWRLLQNAQNGPKFAAYARWERNLMYLIMATTDPALLQNNHEYSQELIDLGGVDLNRKIQEYRRSRPSGKMRALRSILQMELENNPNEKILIWCSFRGTINKVKQMIEQEFHLQVRTIDGSIKKDTEPTVLAKKEKILKEFKTCPDIKILIANPASLAESVSLHKVCHLAIYVDRTFSAGNWIQSKKRIHRVGLIPGTQTRYIVLQSKYIDGEESIDHVINTSLTQKELSQNRFLRENDEQIPQGQIQANFDEIVADNNENTEGDLGGDVNDDENTGVNDERNNVIGMVEDHLRKVVNDENN
jgi:SNF2 family DNA or RNA helicase